MTIIDNRTSHRVSFDLINDKNDFSNLSSNPPPNSPRYKSIGNTHMHTRASTKVDQMAQPNLNETSSSNFHIAMFPWFAIGHAIPFLHLSNELAARGHKISFLLPKKAQIQIQHLNLHPQLIAFCSVTVPHIEGLPEGTETASDIPTSSTALLATAMDRTRQQIEGFLVSCGANDRKIDMIFYDFAHWVPEITRGLGIKCINYGVLCAATTAMAIVPARNVPKDRPVTEEDLRDPPPGYPSSTVVMLPGREVQSLMFITMPYGDGITFYERLMTSKKGCDALSTCSSVTQSKGNRFSPRLGFTNKESSQLLTKVCKNLTI
ncbi:hypothetical protein PRUPE_4G173700 [Prunus persica]|uniref:Uncharacterized protein n=2 Tax=Prunus persica TaxID=3760 RepID=A0A251PLY1_PRUPE|nr:hypothetical protein PRUPE_4G173700 [Prunus persica]